MSFKLIGTFNLYLSLSDCEESFLIQNVSFCELKGHKRLEAKFNIYVRSVNNTVKAFLTINLNDRSGSEK